MELCIIPGKTVDDISKAFATQCVGLLGNEYAGRDGRSTLQNIQVLNKGRNEVPKELSSDHKNWIELIQAQFARNRDLRAEGEEQQYINLGYRNQVGHQCLGQCLSFKPENGFLVVRVETSTPISATGFAGGFGNASLMSAATTRENATVEAAAAPAPEPATKTKPAGS